MGLLSKTVSLTRYHIEGTFDGNPTEQIRNGLKRHAIPEIDGDISDRIAGWTSFEDPYAPDFDNIPFIFGSYYVFSLRIDKKNIPSKVVKKQFAVEMKKRLKESGREFLTRNEKKMLKEHVVNTLSLRIPSTPNHYDLFWNYEAASLWFFSTQKAANEELETLFSRSFKLRPIRLFPYTCADLTADLSDRQKDGMANLTPSVFTAE
jgi:recombination associated protein RdgC